MVNLCHTPDNSMNYFLLLNCLSGVMCTCSVWTGTYVQVSGSQKLIQSLSALLLEKERLTELGAYQFLQVVCRPWAPRICLSPPPQYWEAWTQWPWLAFYVGAATSCMAGIFTNLTVSPVPIAFFIYDFRYFWIVSFSTQWESKSLRSSFPKKQKPTCDTHFSALHAIKTSAVYKVIDGLNIYMFFKWAKYRSTRRKQR